MLQRKAIARESYRVALRLRQKHGIEISDAICVVDLCEKEGIDVKFLDISSFEGLYCKSIPPAVFISALRPSGRQNFTCAHELGHHCFGHGEHLDVLVENSMDAGTKLTDEFIADRFAATLLMPHVAIDFGFNSRGWKASSGNPSEYYIVSSWLGVGYTTLVNHLAYTLKGINSSVARQLKLSKPIDIKSELLECDFKNNLLVIDKHWRGRAADVQVDDKVLLPAWAVVEGGSVEIAERNDDRLVLTAISPGISRVSVDSEHAVFIRVSRKNYAGRAVFRFLEEA